MRDLETGFRQHFGGLSAQSRVAIFQCPLLKTFGFLPGAIRGLPFDWKVETLLLDRSDVALIVRLMLVASRQLREQIVAVDKAIRALVKSNSACRLLMSAPGIGVLSALV